MYSRIYCKGKNFTHKAPNLYQNLFMVLGVHDPSNGSYDLSSLYTEEASVDDL